MSDKRDLPTATGGNLGEFKTVTFSANDNPTIASCGPVAISIITVGLISLDKKRYDELIKAEQTSLVRKGAINEFMKSQQADKSRIAELEKALELCKEAFKKQIEMRMWIGEPAYVIARNTMEELEATNALKGSDGE